MRNDRIDNLNCDHDDDEKKIINFIQIIIIMIEIMRNYVKIKHISL